MMPQQGNAQVIGNIGVCYAAARLVCKALEGLF
jgi:hypothetical protein